MERIKRFRKKPRSGRHVFSYKGKRKSTVPGDIIEVTPDCLGSCVAEYDDLGFVDSHMDTIDVTTLDGPTAFLMGDPPTAILEIRQRPGAKGYYDIINPINPDKPLNDKALRKTAAKACLTDMMNKLGEEIGKLSLDDMDFDDLLAYIEESDIEAPPSSISSEEDLRQYVIDNA